MTFDEEGRLFVVDMLRHDVKIFDIEGTFLGQFGGWFGPETGGRAPGEMLYPNDIAIAPDGHAFYIDEITSTTADDKQLAPMTVRRILLAP